MTLTFGGARDIETEIVRWPPIEQEKEAEGKGSRRPAEAASRQPIEPDRQKPDARATAEMLTRGETRHGRMTKQKTRQPDDDRTAAAVASVRASRTRQDAARQGAWRRRGEREAKAKNERANRIPEKFDRLQIRGVASWDDWRCLFVRGVRIESRRIQVRWDTPSPQRGSVALLSQRGRAGVLFGARAELHDHPQVWRNAI
jgi:hypothetical protein